MSDKQGTTSSNESDKQHSVNEQTTEAAKLSETDQQETVGSETESQSGNNTTDHPEKKAAPEEATAKTTPSSETPEDTAVKASVGDEDDQAKEKAEVQAAAKAKVAKARPKREVKKKEEEPLEPSPSQPVLDAYVAKIKAQLGDETVEEATINRPNGHMPTIRVQREKWLEIAKFLQADAELAFDYLKDLTAYDDKDYMSVVVHLYSLPRKAMLAIHVHTERDPAWVPSVAEVWSAANWHERETYDLFGIEFRGHPNLKRIMMPDDWVGYPLRKDYVPLDEEV